MPELCFVTELVSLVRWMELFFLYVRQDGYLLMPNMLNLFCTCFKLLDHNIEDDVGFKGERMQRGD